MFEIQEIISNRFEGYQWFLSNLGIGRCAIDGSMIRGVYSPKTSFTNFEPLDDIIELFLGSIIKGFEVDRRLLVKKS